MKNLRALLLAGFVGLAVMAFFASRSDAKPDMVTKIADGIWFREGNLGIGHCNNVIVEMKDYLIVVDANFPSGARLAMADAKKVSEKPVKYVFDTHHHGDHAYGNAVWAKAGAKVLASAKTARLLKVNGPKQWEEQSKDRKDLRESELKGADESFDEKLVLDDGTQRVEFL